MPQSRAPSIWLFDAVIFDLDGTLVATDRFWAAAAAKGAERAFRELGLQRELPQANEWMAMVGMPLEHAFEMVFADLHPQVRAVVMARCVEEEHAALRAGGAAEMPGASELLGELRAKGLRVGIASNCSQQYLDDILDGLDLRRFVDAARCLESPGIRSKTDMLGDLLATFGTRSAVMVGDRASDRDAAHTNGIPHVHLTSGFAPPGERVSAEAHIGALAELRDTLATRAQWIEGALALLGVLQDSARGWTIGVTGRSASGKTLFARDAAVLLRASGRAAAVVSLDAFTRTSGARIPGAQADHLACGFDLERFTAAIAGPRSRGESIPAGPWGAGVPAGAVLLVDGLFLADPRLRPVFQRLVQLEVPDELAIRRAAARGADGDALVASLFLPAQRAFEARFDPRRHADLVLDAVNPLGG